MVGDIQRYVFDGLDPVAEYEMQNGQRANYYRGALGRIAERRLRIMRETDDGFRIAEEDLRLRGPGEVLGTRQTGLMEMRVADLLRDQGMLPDVRQVADELLAGEAAVATALIDRWIGEASRYGKV